MKYFTKELWAGHNSRSDVDMQRAFEQSKQNSEEYDRQLKQLERRLSKKAYRFFTAESLHDGRFWLSPPAIPSAMISKALKNSTSMSITFLSDEPLFHDEGGHIGDWGYDELTANDVNYLQHEVLFASGTTILIEFKEFSYERVEFEGTRYI